MTQFFPGTHPIYLAFRMFSWTGKDSQQAIWADESRWWLSGFISDIWLTRCSPVDWLDLRPAKWKWISHEAFGTSTWVPYPRVSELALSIVFLLFFSSVLSTARAKKSLIEFFVLKQRFHCQLDPERLENEANNRNSVDSSHGRWKDNWAIIGELLFVAISSTVSCKVWTQST